MVDGPGAESPAHELVAGNTGSASIVAGDIPGLAVKDTGSIESVSGVSQRSCNVVSELAETCADQDNLTSELVTVHGDGEMVSKYESLNRKESHEADDTSISDGNRHAPVVDSTKDYSTSSGVKDLTPSRYSKRKPSKANSSTSNTIGLAIPDIIEPVPERSTRTRRKTQKLIDYETANKKKPSTLSSKRVDVGKGKGKLSLQKERLIEDSTPIATATTSLDLATSTTIENVSDQDSINLLLAPQPDKDDTVKQQNKNGTNTNSLDKYSKSHIESLPAKPTPNDNRLENRVTTTKTGPQLKKTNRATRSVDNTSAVPPHRLSGLSSCTTADVLDEPTAGDDGVKASVSTAAELSCSDASHKQLTFSEASVTLIKLNSDDIPGSAPEPSAPHTNKSRRGRPPKTRSSLSVRGAPSPDNVRVASNINGVETKPTTSAAPMQADTVMKGSISSGCEVGTVSKQSRPCRVNKRQTRSAVNVDSEMVVPGPLSHCKKTGGTSKEPDAGTALPQHELPLADLHNIVPLKKVKVPKMADLSKMDMAEHSALIPDVSLIGPHRKSRQTRSLRCEQLSTEKKLTQSLHRDETEPLVKSAPVTSAVSKTRGSCKQDPVENEIPESNCKTRPKRTNANSLSSSAHDKPLSVKKGSVSNENKSSSAKNSRLPGESNNDSETNIVNTSSMVINETKFRTSKVKQSTRPTRSTVDAPVLSEPKVLVAADDASLSVSTKCMSMSNSKESEKRQSSIRKSRRQTELTKQIADRVKGSKSTTKKRSQEDDDSDNSSVHSAVSTPIKIAKRSAGPLLFITENSTGECTL